MKSGSGSCGPVNHGGGGVLVTWRIFESNLTHSGTYSFSTSNEPQSYCS